MTPDHTSIDLDELEADACLAVNYGENPQMQEQSRRILSLISQLRSEAEAHKWQSAECERLRERLTSAEEALNLQASSDFHEDAKSKARAHFEKYK